MFRCHPTPVQSHLSPQGQRFANLVIDFLCKQFPVSSVWNCIKRFRVTCVTRETISLHMQTLGLLKVSVALYFLF